MSLDLEKLVCLLEQDETYTENRCEGLSRLVAWTGRRENSSSMIGYEVLAPTK